MASWVWTPHVQVPSRQSSSDSKLSRPRTRFSRFHHQTYSFVQNRNFSRYNRSYCTPNDNNSRPERSNIQLYGEIERLLTDAIMQSQNAWGSSEDWRELEGAWVLKPKSSKPTSVIHFIGGIFVGAAPQLTYRLFLERLSENT